MSEQENWLVVRMPAIENVSAEFSGKREERSADGETTVEENVAINRGQPKGQVRNLYWLL